MQTSRARRVAAAACIFAALHGCTAPTLDDVADSTLLRLGAAAPDVAGPPMFERGVVFGSVPGKAGSHAATLTELPDGTLLAAWYSYDGPHELDGSAIYTARRPPGDEWTPPTRLIDRPEGDGNPVLYAEGSRVWLFQAVIPFGWSTARIEFQTSADAGQSWSAPEPLAGPLGANVRFPPLRLADGRLLLPAYDDLLQRALFFAADAEIPTEAADWRLLAIRDSGTLGTSAIQPAVARRADGSLLAVMRSSGGRLLASAAGADGRSWSLPQAGELPNPGSAAALLRLAGGRLLLVFNDSATRRTPLSVTLSADGGATWSRPRVLVDGPGDVDYPAALQSSDGMIHVLFSEDRARIGHVRINEAWIADGDS